MRERNEGFLGRWALQPAELRQIVGRALDEDLAGYGDVTSQALISDQQRARGKVLVQCSGVVAGLAVVREVFQVLDPETRTEFFVADGAFVEPGVTVATVEGRAWAILAGERTALNFLGRLSGIATRTRAFVDAVSGTKAVILATRKTTPGLRLLEKYAVVCGGGQPHRFGLFDGILIKDNHRVLCGGIRFALERLDRFAFRSLPIEVEVDTLEELKIALEFEVPWILLDNFSLSELRQAVALVEGRARLEASGGITLATVREVAETGVDAISVGGLTHSAPYLDVSLVLEPLPFSG